MRVALFTLTALLLMPMPNHAQGVTRLSGDDVIFFSAGIADDTTKTGSKIGSIGKPSNTRVCGFQIRGNHNNRANPHVEWDLNIDQIVAPDRTVAGVSAGSFDVINRKRTPRLPIAEMGFLLKDVPEPIVAAIQGTPNADNAIVALLEAEPAGRLFAEFQTMRPIIIALRYSDGSGDQLEVRGFRDDRKFGGGKNSYFAECLRGFRAKVQGEVTTTVR